MKNILKIEDDGRSKYLDETLTNLWPPTQDTGTECKHEDITPVLELSTASPILVNINLKPNRKLKIRRTIQNFKVVGQLFLCFLSVLNC